MGRPSKANDAILKEAIRLASEGKTDAQIAKEVGVTKTTVQNWKKKHPDFFDLLKKSKKSADQKVETSLFQRACGYSHPSEKIFLTKDGTVVRAPFIEHYPPDPTSMIFWLKNRDRERWRDKQEVEHEFGPKAEKLVTRLAAALSRVNGKDG
jgi:hypothetical protein